MEGLGGVYMCFKISWVGGEGGFTCVLNLLGRWEETVGDEEIT